MYFNSKIHILSTALFGVAVVNTLAEGGSGFIRMVMRRGVDYMPDMINGLYQYVSIAAALFRIVMAVVILCLAWRRLSRYKSLFSAEDRDEIGLLQEEYLRGNKSALTVVAIEQLVLVWAVILVGVELVYDVTSEWYALFINQMSGMVDYQDPASIGLFVSLYNSTHGFKYIGMMIAILMGIIVTGIFLRDRLIVASAGISTLVFMAAFFLVNMETFVIFGKMVGIVWTSVVFHAMQTVGILVFALYLRLNYRGL